MTINELNKLTPEQKRVKIAEACGWTQVQGGALPTPGGLSTLFGRWDLCGVIPGDSNKSEYNQSFIKIPDYLNDLNAMREAERVLTAEQHFEFRQNLWSIAVTLMGKPPKHCPERYYISATAAQRADAFLLTIEKEGQGL